MSEVPIGGHTYRIRQLIAIQQLHLLRRLGPLLASLGVTVDEDGKPKVGNPFEQLAPAAQVLAGMADADVESLVNLCLSAVDRQDGPAWRPVMINGAMMYSADLGLPTMLQLVWEVAKTNLGNFTTIAQSLGASTANAEA